MKAEHSNAVSLTIEKNEFKNIKEILNQPILNLNLSNNVLRVFLTFCYIF